jgi:hypothetical protein
VHLKAPDPKQLAARKATHAISDADLPLERGSRDHEALAPQHEDTIHRKPKVTLPTRLVDPAECQRDLCANVFEALASGE